SELDEILRKRQELDQIIDNRFKHTVAVLFTDIVGSTSYFSTRGDLEGRLMIQRHNDLLIPLLSKHQGKLIRTIGDALMVSFGDPANAVACAVGMQEALTQYNAKAFAPDQIHIRIGINVGLSIVEAGDIYGDVVNVAARVESLAEGDQIL